MKSEEMEDVARFFARALIEGEDPSSVKADVREFKSQFQTVHYCFEPGPAYPDCDHPQRIQSTPLSNRAKRPSPVSKPRPHTSVARMYDPVG